MDAVIDYAEARYRLLHDDRYLDAFLDRDEVALGLPPVELALLLKMDSGAALWDARGKRRDVYRRLTPAFAAVFDRWARFMGDDPNGDGLVTLFLRSADYRSVHTGEVVLHAAFRTFARRTGVFPEELLWPVERLAAK